MGTALATIAYKPTELSTERLGQVLVKSGFFKDLRDEAQAITKILYGRELGFGPMASVMGVYIVDGKPSLSAQLIASAIQSHPVYRYRVREWTPTACRIEFFERDESLGFSSFTIEEATAAGLANKSVWKQYPKAMLWARAMSQGARAYAAEIFSGAVYTPEELGAMVDGDGRVIEIEPLGDSQPFVPIREREVDDQPRDTLGRTAEQKARERWLEACAWAEKFKIAHKDLPPDAPLDGIERWTAALNERIAKAEAAAKEAVPDGDDDEAPF